MATTNNDDGCSLVLFYLPTNLPANAELKFLPGFVIKSNQEGIHPGNTVSVSIATLKNVLPNFDKGNEFVVFRAKLKLFENPDASFRFNWYAFRLAKHDLQERRLLKELIQSGAPELIMRLSEQIKYLSLALQECQV